MALATEGGQWVPCVSLHYRKVWLDDKMLSRKCNVFKTISKTSISSRTAQMLLLLSGLSRNRVSTADIGAKFKEKQRHQSTRRKTLPRHHVDGRTEEEKKERK